MKKYQVYVEINSARGYQVYAVEAESKEEAAANYYKGEYMRDEDLELDWNDAYGDPEDPVVDEVEEFEKSREEMSLDMINMPKQVVMELEIAHITNALVSGVREVHETTEETLRRVFEEYRDCKYKGIIMPNSLLSRLRPAVLWFVLIMEDKLSENGHKGGWKNCDMGYLRKRLGDDPGKLRRILDKKPSSTFDLKEWAKLVGREAAGVANIAMMIADRAYGDLKAKQKKCPLTEYKEE